MSDVDLEIQLIFCRKVAVFTLVQTAKDAIGAPSAFEREEALSWLERYGFAWCEMCGLPVSHRLFVTWLRELEECDQNRFLELKRLLENGKTFTAATTSPAAPGRRIENARSSQTYGDFNQYLSSPRLPGRE
jgi:hypothetical protein